VERQNIASVWLRRRKCAVLPILGMAGVAIGFFLLERGDIQLPDGANEHVILGLGYVVSLLFLFLYLL